MNYSKQAGTKGIMIGEIIDRMTEREVYNTIFKKAAYTTMHDKWVSAILSAMMGRKRNQFG